MTRPWMDLIRDDYRPLVALRHVAAISQYHRIQASPGYRAAAGYVADHLAAAGVDVKVRSYPADRAARFWSTPGFQEWECTAATLDLLDDENQPAERLCDFAAIPISVIQRSIPAAGDFELVLLPGKGQAASDYEGLDLAGKLVLTDQAPGSLLEMAVRRHGAAGFVFDGMAAGGRSDLDLPDARQYTSFWWAGPAEPDAFGFVLSPRQGRLLRSRLGQGAAVRVRARISSRLYDGQFEVVDAVIPGAAGGPAGASGANAEVLLVAHLCHPQPGAHDNGSGSAALLEAAATLARLMAEGRLPRPQRSIRCLWLPEMTGTYAWLAEHEAQVRQGRWLAGLNLDMVGADQNQSGSVWRLIQLPQAAAAFPDHLLAWLREPYLAGQRHSEAPFEAGSDHYILSDPSVGIPAPMLIQWPDRFYHTSADTWEKVSPDSLGRSGALAAAYAYWIAAAGPAEACWLGHWMLTRFAAQAGGLAAAAAQDLRQAEAGAARAERWRQYRRASAFAAERRQAALASLLRLDPEAGGEVAGWQRQAAELSAREDAWLAAQAQSLGLAPGEQDEPADALPGAEARSLVPVRLCPGPVDVERAVACCAPELRDAWAAMAGHDHSVQELEALLLYWADGKRTIAEIAAAVALEPGHSLPPELPEAYFKLLAGMGLVALKPA